jgi:hypothetical protein
MDPQAFPRRAVRSVTTFFAVFIGITAGAALLRAGPPFFTDDPEPVDYRHWEFYVASQQARDRDGVSGTAPHFEINYGIAPDMMLHVISPLSFNKPSGRPFRYGLGDMELGLKYRFVRETGGRPQIGAFPHLEVPTGSRGRGLGNGKPQLFIPVWIQKSWGSWTTYGGGGYWINPGSGNRNYWSVGWEVQRDLSRRVTVGGEIFGNTSSAIGQGGQAGFNLGAIFSFGGGHQIMVSAGRDFLGTNTLFFYVAYYLTVGPRD